ncbi:MAG: anaerobic ribonucleoside-triphosphate reductase activating protein [Oscillospiraceae bacterium]|nr:anaerobic ribonucleoside-triphosphate reductase activating protein [Oscillospiraceae bacterium]
MEINGLQKLTLLDYPGRTACTVFLAGCNYRCPFCHNAALVVGGDSVDLIPQGEFFAYLEKRRGVLEGVCITGGEPTLRPDLEEFAARIHSLGYLVKLDTNGTRPEVIKRMAEAGLVDRFAMDVKASREEYPALCGAVPHLDAVEESIDFLMSSGTEYEFRTTLVKGLHTPRGVEDLARRLSGAKAYFLQQFRDSGSTIEPGLEAFDEEEMRSLLETVRKYVPAAQLRGL